MTVKQILTGLPEWLNEQTAIAMGWPKVAIKDYSTDGYINLVIGNDIYFHIGKNGRIYRIGMGLMDESAVWNPAENIQDAMVLQKIMDKKGFWLRLESPFSSGSEWFAGFTPHEMTGWNGTPDNFVNGKTHAEAITKAFLLTCLSEKLCTNEESDSIV
jgi:hypothetical protein